MGTKLPFCLCTYRGCGRNSSWIELRDIQDRRRDNRGDGPESKATPFAAIVGVVNAHRYNKVQLEEEKKITNVP